MIDIALSKELKGYAGDKKMTELAISTTQNRMAEKLNGEMGEDMKAVLNGEMQIKPTTYENNKFKLISWFKRMFRMF